MADDTDTQVAQAQAPPPPDLSNLSQTDLANALRTLQAVPPPVTVDQTPVDRSWTSKIGEFLGGGGGPGAAALSPAQKEAAGSQALRDFGIHLMLASHYVPGQTLFSNLGQGLLGAEQSYQGQEQQAAGVLASKQGYQQEQQQMNIQRIKAALPLLSLQAQQAAGQRALGIGLGNQSTAPSTNIGTGGSVGQVNVPPEYLPFYQAASARTGIPVETLIAQSRQESGFNPNATGKAGEIGIAQVMPATAKDPGFGMAPVDPKALRDPETAINFQADYLKAHLPKGADPTDPVAIAKALQGYNGGGDPNYVANVNRYLPGARAALAPPPRPGAQPTAASPPPVSGTVAPPVAGARPVLPPPQPAIAPNAGAQVAGPAAPTSGVIPPSPPGSAGDVATIRGAMVGAGANPVTLAPGQGSAPAPQGATVVAGTPQATTQPGSPPTVNPYGPDWKPGPITIPNLPRYQIDTLTPAQSAIFDRRMREVAGLPNSADKISQIEQDKAAQLAANNKDAYDAQDAYRKEQETAQLGIAKNIWDQQNAQAKVLQEQENARQTALQKASTDAQQTELTSNLEIRKDQIQKLRATSSSAADAVDQLRAIVDLNRSAGPTSLLPDALKNNLIRLNIATPEQAQSWSAQQALTGASNRLLGLIRSGTGFSRTTNQDLSFLTRSLPANADDNQEYRDAKTGFLLSAYKHQQDYANALEQHVSDGMKWGDAQKQADIDAGPIIPQTLSTDQKNYDPNDPNAADKWNFDHLENGQFYKNRGGQLAIFHRLPNTVRPE